MDNNQKLNLQKLIKDNDVKDVIRKQIQLKNKIINNSEIAQNLSLGKFSKKDFQDFAATNTLEIKTMVLKNIKNNETFSESLIRRIFETNDGEIKLISSPLDTDFFGVVKL